VIETVGVGEIAKLELSAQSATNITVPMQIVIHGQEVPTASNNMYPNVLLLACNSTDIYHKKSIEISFDIMPVIRMFNYPVATVVFHGQKVRIPCDEVSNIQKR
jgi:hypothetical protein